MNPHELIRHLRAKGIGLSVKKDKLVCDAPKNTIDKELLAKIKSLKPELVVLLNKDSSGPVNKNEPQFKANNQHVVHSLSYAQKRMMYLHSMQVDKGSFNINLVYKIDGPLKTEKLDTAVRKVVERHAILRTCFNWIDGDPTQTIWREMSKTLTHIDLRVLDAPDINKIAIGVIEKESIRPFNIDRSTIFRAILVQISDTSFYFLINSHYLVADEYSMELIAEQISSQYNAGTKSEKNNQISDFQYIDFVEWEKQFLDCDQGKEQLKFWSDRLKAGMESGNSDRKRKDIKLRSFSATSVEFKIPQKMTSDLDAISKKHQVSLFMMTYAIFTILIRQIYQNTEFYCGTPIVNRSRIELENMVGYFANTLILNNSLMDTKLFHEYLQELKIGILETISNGDIPFEYALEKSGLNANPFTRFMFTYTEDANHLIKFDHTKTERIVIVNNMQAKAVAELSLLVRHADGELFCSFQIANEILNSKMIDTMKSDYLNLVEAILSNSQETITGLAKACKTVKMEPDLSNIRSRKKTKTRSIKSKDNQSDAIMDLEPMLKEIWQGVLNVKKVNTDDNFFSLGGTSFKAVKVFSEIHKKSGIKLPLATLFHSPTIESLAKLISEDRSEYQWSPIVPIQTKGNRPPLYFVHGAGGNVILYRDLSRRLGDHQPFYGIQAKGLDGKTEMLTSVEEMAITYVNEIYKIQSEGPYYVGGYCLGGQIAYEMARIFKLNGDDVGMVALLDTQRSWITDNDNVSILKSKYEKVVFHLKNLSMANFRGKIDFLTEKSKELTRRICRRLKVYLSKMLYNLKLRSESPLVIMEDINDRAANTYIALPIDGEIDIFSPKKNYLGYNDPKMGWGGGLAKDVNVHNLTMYPAGMLVEPFVQELAARISNCVDRTIEKPKN